MSDVADKIKKIICEQLDVPEEDVVPDASFVDDLSGLFICEGLELIMGNISAMISSKSTTVSVTVLVAIRLRVSQSRSPNIISLTIRIFIFERTKPLSMASSKIDSNMPEYFRTLLYALCS